MQCPCKDCDRRVSGCHSMCDDYKSWKAEQDRIVDERRKAREAEPAICRKVQRQIYKAMKGRR